MKKHTPTLYVPTLVDSADHRHITADAGRALCGATGIARAPHDHPIDTLCLQCRLEYRRQLADERMTRFGI